MPSRSPLPVYVETGRKRVFAAAIEWPGWCRSGRDEGAALQALVAYGPRYAAAMGQAASKLTPPANTSSLVVKEHLPGNASTDFGVPDASPAVDGEPIDAQELERWISLLQAAWTAFDRTAKTASGAMLRKGPRGGGRGLDAIVGHALDAEGAYLARMGGRYRPDAGTDVHEQMREVRAEMVGALRARARGDPLPESRGTAKAWTPRYGIRRSAWHALDHAWEIEDRAAH